MGKMLRISLAMMVSVLSVFLVAGGAGAASCPTTLTSANCGCVADSPNTTYTLSEDMVCSTRHGIIIGAPGVTIDGAGHKLDGSGTPIGNRHCEANVYLDHGSVAMWCTGHPCRQADVQPHDNDRDTYSGCIDSGIVNAGNETAVTTGSCQGGFSNVTIKNLEITGWCNGITMSGRCDPEERLTGILIEGNCIHDNGGGDCGSYTPEPTGDGGDWEHRYYNDAIFTAEIGISASESDKDVDCREYKVGHNEYPDLIENGSELPSNRNIIRHNLIYNQKGCGTVSCPGGNGINLQGGMEIDHPIWSGCNEIEKNYIKHCAMSGIQYTHATTHNRIHGNYLVGNGFGGITDPCPWCHDNYLYDNVAKDNYGCGIGINAMGKIMNNYCLDTMPVQNSEYSKLGYGGAANGVGIMTVEVCGDYGSNIICTEGEPSKILGNTCVGNADQDIKDAGNDGAGGVATGSQNMCKTGGGFTPGCQYLAGDRLNCRADLNHDCKVSYGDFDILSGHWNWGLDPSKPKCCPGF